MPTQASILKAVRLTHLYLGVFAAPAILFFAFTGAIQTFSLHETTKGSSYTPPRILVILGQIHKKQTPVVAPPRKPDAPGAPKSEKRPDASPSQTPGPVPAPLPQHNPLPLKIFFLLIAISLFTSTLTGIYMSYKYTRNKIAITTLLVLGAVIPILMVLI